MSSKISEPQKQSKSPKNVDYKQKKLAETLRANLKRRKESTSKQKHCEK